jgi:hypothetical protein
MEISKDVFKSVSNTVNEFMKNKHYELEMRYGGKNVKITRDNFTNTLNYFRSNGYKEQDHVETLDVHFMYGGYAYRISIGGKDNIKDYCLTNKVTSGMVKEVISKRFVNNFRPTLIPDFNLKIDLKNEVPIDDITLNELLVYLEGAMKGFRYKKRYSYTSTTRGSPFRYDFTVVKRSNMMNSDFICNKRFSTSTILSATETYEMEIEVPNIKREKIDSLAADFIKAGIHLYAVVNGIPNVISKKKKNDVLIQYLTLQNKKVPIQQVLDKPKSYFIGPQPVTLELKDITTDGLPVNTILNDYTVTEKADGERYLLFVNKDGESFLINNKMEVFALSVQLNNVRDCIFDGEYITRDAEGRKIRIFAMFDVYYYDGVDTMRLPLVSDIEDSRVKKMDTFCSKFKDRFSKEILIHTKKFYKGADIFKEVRDVLNKVNSGSYIYRIDGLIFTPQHLPVGGLYKGKNPEPQGPWMKALKWKPPSENTIDMQVKENGSSSLTVVGSKMMKVYNLFIGYKPSQWEPIKPRIFLEKKLRQDTRYTIIPFAPSTVLDRNISMFYGDMDAHGVTKCLNGDEISNNCIVEFAYIDDTSLSFPLRWKPLRVRKDKVSPNDFSTAMNVWRSIEMPVTEDMISGNVKTLMKDLPEEDVYYKRFISRDQFASRNMMDFHNYWNKYRFLLSKYVQPGNTLFDIACGQGGDLKRWIDCGLSTVYGIDKVRNNIENPSSGIYSRLLKLDWKDIKAPEYVFGTMDASMEINESYVKSLGEKDDVYIGDKILKYGKFDMVSCQFAIHYFFENETILDNFVKNVDRFLKDGGYFMGTCLDGTRVKRLLKDVPTQSAVTGKQDDRFLWNITKLYDSEEPPVFGDQIKVYMESIGIEIPEYLVNTSILIDKFKEYGIEPVEIRSFEDTHKEVMNMDVDKRNAYYHDAAKNMSDLEKTYSFMNIIFVFQKVSKNEGKKVVAKKKVVVKKSI